jgi:hypothetical protein
VPLFALRTALVADGHDFGGMMVLDRRANYGTLTPACALAAISRLPRLTHGHGEAIMNEETFNLSLRKFLKMVGVSSQNEIEGGRPRARAKQRNQVVQQP